MGAAKSGLAIKESRFRGDQRSGPHRFKPKPERLREELKDSIITVMNGTDRLRNLTKHTADFC